MANTDYKNFFNNSSPLNIYNKDISGLSATYMLRQDGTSQDKLLSSPQSPIESDEQYAQRLLKEEQEYLDYLKRQKEYNNLLNLERLQALFNRITNPKNNVPNKSLKELAEEDVVYGVNPTTNKTKHPALTIENRLNTLNTIKEKQDEYQKEYDDINSLGKALVNFDSDKENKSKEFDALKNTVYEILKEKNAFNSKDKFDKWWDSRDEEDKLLLITAALGKKHFTDEALEEFKSYDNKERFEMLASYIKNNPFYESLVSKHKKNINWGDNKLAKEWQQNTEYATNRFLYGITGGRGWNPLGTFADVVGAGALAGVGEVGNIVGNIVGKLGEYAQSRIEGMGTEEDVDDLITENANNYISKKSQQIYERLQAANPEDKETYIKNFEKLSEAYSKEYNANKGNSLTSLEGVEKNETPENIKLKLYANFIASMEMFGELAAAKNIQDFWKNTVSDNLGEWDKILRTSETFFQSGVADMASFASLIANPLFMIVEHNGSANPLDWTVDGEGYSDALVKRNPILNWAVDLLETGAWLTENQKKYKELGVNANQIYRSISLENSYMSWDDAYDIVGQYGFTAATTLLSLGGSGVIRASAKSAAKNALKSASKGVRGKIADIFNKEARLILKNALKVEATSEEITAAKEVAAEIAAKRLYRGNLAISGMLGTAEGALEAKSTYNLFILENLDKELDKIALKQEMLDNVSILDLREYMINSGYEPKILTRGPEGIVRSDFTEELYELARLELQNSLNESRLAIIDRIEDNATDAAATNFIVNSFINGACNVLLKESLLSRDAREASRILKGKNKYLDLVDIVLKGDSWEAVIKKAVDATNKRSVWKKVLDTSKKTLSTAFGEAAEEYSQNLSDKAARDALQYDLNLYLNTVYNKEVRDAFQTDLAKVVNTGLNSIATNTLDWENIKAGIYGALSASIGGFNPAGFFEFKGKLPQDKGILGTAKAVAKNLSKLYLGGIILAYRENSEELLAAQRLVENINSWLNTEKNQELLVHMGGAAGFKKSLEDAILANDALTAHDSKLGLAVENAFMLLALKNTEFGKAMLLKVKENAELKEIAENKDGIFDSNGNYIGNQQDLNGQLVRVDDWISSAISTFRNLLGEDTRNSNLTDLQIAERIGTNALEFLDLQNKIAIALRKIQNIFKNSNLDPLAELAFVYALMFLDNTRERANKLGERLYEVLSEENIDQLENEQFQKSGLSNEAIDFIIEHGSLEKAEASHKNILEQINELSEILRDKKKTREEKSQAKNRLKQLDKIERSLRRQIAKEKDRREKDLIINQTTTSDGKTLNVIENEAPTEFSIGDIIAMSDNQRASIIANKLKYSETQQKIINDFLNFVRTNLLNKENDLIISKEEVAKDFIDLTVLRRRSNAYDDYLSDFINDPRFLSTTAATYREKERTRTLRYLYKDELQLRKGESVLDFKDRLDKKVQKLLALGKEEDASILKKLIGENEEVAKIDRNINEVLLATFMYGILNREKLDTKEFDMMNAALLTAISNSGKSMLELKEILDKLDTETLVEFLLRQTSDGQNVLNKTLLKRGYEAINLTGDIRHDEGQLALIIQNMKNFLDFYAKAKNQLGPILVNNPEVIGPATTSTSTANTLNSSASVSVDNINAEKEEALLKITTPGDIEQSSPLGEFLKEYEASENIAALDNRKNPIINFAVLPTFGPSVVFALVKVRKDSKGRTLNIDGGTYKVIGLVNYLNVESSTIESLAKKSFELLIQGEEGRLLLNTLPIRAEIASLKDPKYISNQHLEEAKPLIDILGNDIAISAYIGGLLAKGVVKEEVDANGDKSSSLQLDGKPVFIDENSEACNDFWKFPVGDTTLENILKGCDFTDETSVKEAINKLSQNEFFRAFFDVWNNFSATYNLNDRKSWNAIYYKLLGDFVFMGYPDEGDKRVNLNARIDENGNLIINSVNKDEYENRKTVTIELPGLGENRGEKDNKALALIALAKLMHVKEEKGLEYAKTQIGWDLIKRHKPHLLQVEARRLKGLIQAGLLMGFKTDAIKRHFYINNPFIDKSSKEKSNDNNASQFDPKEKGVVEGGVVNVFDGSTKEGNPVSTETKVGKALNELLKRALAIVDKIIKVSSTITQKNSNSETYQKNGTDFSRVTSVKQAYKGADTHPFTANDSVSKLSHAYGNTVDAILRAAIEILNNDSTKDSELLFNDILKDEVFKGKNELPNWNKHQMKRFLELVIILHKVLKANGLTIFSKNIKTFGTAKVFNLDIQVGTIPIAGTLDLLAYDELGIFHIIDIKTLHLSDLGVNALDANKAEWEAQTSPYQGTLQQLYEGMRFGLNYILPVFLPYSIPANNIPVKVEEDGMTVTTQRPNEAPRFLSSGKNEYTLEDFLYPVDYLEFEGYEESRLSESDKARINRTTVQVQPIIPEKPILKNPIQLSSTGTIGESVEDIFNTLFDDDSKYSRRSVRLAKYTDFINSHLTPVLKIKVNIVTKAKSIIKSLLGKSGKEVVFSKEVANIFFNGDTEKLNILLKGKKVTDVSTQELLLVLRDYFNSYIGNYESYISNITRRHYISKAVYNFLKGEISLNALEGELEKYLISIKDVSELVEYMSSTDKLATADEIINKLEVQKNYTIEKYNLQIKAIKETINSMQAKVDFLESTQAESMLSNRLNSVYTAITNNSYTEQTYRRNGTIEELLNTKSGSYGAIKLLRGISVTTKNANFKRLANILLHEINNRKLIIPVVIEDGALNFIEGSTTDNVICILKHSLDSYEHFERVLLHEMIHAVIKVSPEAKKNLQQLLNQSIASLLRSTGKSINEIKKDYYGLTSVDDFISEFFTNYAFLETLKTLDSSEYKTIFDKFIGFLKELFTKDTSLYNNISEAMESILSSTNVEDAKRSEEKIEESNGKLKFSELSQTELDMIKARGITLLEFNSMLKIVLEHLRECCK